VIGNDISVSLGTDANGALSSTAAQVIEAINAHPGASALVVALTYRGNAGADFVQPRVKVNLSDFLAAPGHVERGPFEQNVLRIGKRRDGSKTGVFLYCQQHAREWATPLTCLETAEQLLRNYAIDDTTHKLVDNLDIFVLPSSNPDGSHYSMYDFSQQRRNMTNHCVNGGKVTDDPFAANYWTPRINPSTGLPYTNTDPASRNLWGVDNNRNNTVGTIFDGCIGASYSCTSDTYTGPSEASEPEIKNELWVADTFTNIKFSNNIHSFGGYFMWAPGAYLPNRDEGDLVHPNIGVEKCFFAAGDQILNRIKDVRGTAILPERTGPIADVLYSAAGNSADEHWYNRGVIAYSFETGADRYVDPTLSVATLVGDTGVRASNRNGFRAGDTVVVGFGTPNAETRTITSVAVSNPPSPAPNVTLDAPLAFAHEAGEVLHGGVLQQGVGFQPDYATEGKFEALEFSAGNFGLLESAYDYEKDKQPPGSG
jgi:Zinc carboxypeptidase